MPKLPEGSKYKLESNGKRSEGITISLLQTMPDYQTFMVFDEESNQLNAVYIRYNDGKVASWPDRTVLSTRKIEEDFPSQWLAIYIRRHPAVFGHLQFRTMVHSSKKDADDALAGQEFPREGWKLYSVEEFNVRCYNHTELPEMKNSYPIIISLKAKNMA